jgi:hypothetical protein
MSHTVETKEYKGYKIKIIIDESASDPREGNDNITTMVCFHRNYRLGDNHDYRADNYSGWYDMRKAIERDHDVVLIEPLYMYNHSGITIATTPFGCRFDSGQIGWVFISKESIRKIYGMKQIRTKWLEENMERLQERLDSDVKVYDDFVSGDCYGYEVVKVTEDEDGEEEEESIDSCWGFYGTDFDKNGLLDYAHNVIDCEVEPSEEEAVS